MDAKLEFEVDVEVPTDMVDRGEERRGEERDSWLVRRGFDK